MSDPAALGAVEVRDVDSDAVGDTFRVFVGHCGDNPSATLFVTDGNGLFGLAVDTVRLMQIPALLPSLLVVGIGYPDAQTVADTLDVRVRDLTPTHSPRWARSGGAPAFLRFICDELAPMLPVSADETIYFGHSLGGLFGVYALLERPGAFTHHIISSPSLWWHRSWLEGLPRPSAFPGTVFCGIGADETDEGRRREGANLPDGHPLKPPSMHLDMVDDLVRFVATLPAGTPCEIYPDEFHATVAGTVLTRGLRRVFSASASAPA